MSRLDSYDDLERSVLNAVPGSYEHVPDEEVEAYDAVATADISPSNELPIVGRSVVPKGTAIEVKTCLEYINDSGSHSNRRRGSFYIKPGPHAHLVDVEGVYLFAIRDEIDGVVASRLIAADDLTPKLSWTNGGRQLSGKRAIVSWPNVIPKRELEESDQ